MKKPLIRISFPIMFCLLSTFVILFAAREALSQVNIPDANLRAAIESELNKESGDTITEAEMASEDFIYLSAENSSISDLTGLEYATSLRSLFLGNNNISDISPLSELTNLTTLGLDDNSITDISDLGLLDRGIVYLNGNPLSDTSINTHIPAFRANGVRVIFVTEKLRIVSGNNQTGLVSTTLPFPLVVEVLDLSDNPVSGVALAFETVGSTASIIGGESVEGGRSMLDVTTGTDGRASVTINLGSRAGNVSIEVIPGNRTDSSAIGVVFTVTATTTPPPPPPTKRPTTLQKVSGDGQSSETGTWLTDSFVVKVLDQNGDALPGVSVSFSVSPSSGTVSSTSRTTNNNGIASTRLKFGSTAGTYTVTARVSGISQPVSFTATATATTTTTTTTPIVTVTDPNIRAVAKDYVIFNEIHNAYDDKHDWIEIKNISHREALLNTWEISIVTSSQDDVDIVSFADLGYKLQPGELLLITNAPHTETDLIRGQDIENPERNTDVLPQYLVAPNLHLPNTPYLLILRSQPDLNGTSYQIEDVAGNYYREVREDNTDIWPLRNTSRPYGDTQFLTQGKAWERQTPIRVGYEQIAWEESGYKSGLGYKPRAPESTSLGTPGYPQDIYRNNTDRGKIIFSEIMYASNGYTDPQWIELYNTSKTEVVNLEGWRLQVEAPEGETYNSFQVIELNPIEIMPMQTILLVTHKARHSENISAQQVYDLSAHHNNVLALNKRPHRIIGITGFSLRLFSADGIAVANSVGNLDGQFGNAEPYWEFKDLNRHGASGRTRDKHRVSLIRRFKDGKAQPGDNISSWKRTARIDFGEVKTYYGNPTDIGNPGYRYKQTPLPVTLSAFNAEVGDTGVVLNWITESELDNAGFNILRSLFKEGPFVNVNPSLIQGAGTTGERNEYTWTDTTVKPNAEYYYQIEDVSFAGVRYTRATKRLKGIFSAKNRLTTRWGDLKSKH